MEFDTLTTVTTAMGGSAIGALTTGWISRLLIKRFLHDNDKKHDLTSDGMKKIANKLGQISTELAVIKNTLGQVTAIKETVASDHDKIVEIMVWNGKYKDDLQAQFSKIRKIEDGFEDVSKLIHGLRREANND